jgi:glycosyltransferase involved in cell wall biosynthesis
VNAGSLPRGRRFETLPAGRSRRLSGPAQSAPEALAPGSNGTRSIEVALTTYNSETFLPALLDSLFSQTRQDFTLLVSDDASTDGTVAILEAYSKRYPGRIRQLAPNPSRLGVIANFDRVLEHSGADYTFLCDHDDVWLAHKIERSMEAMHALEAANAPGTPLLVHTDLAVTGPDLEILSDSFFDYAGVDPAKSSPVKMLLSNVATGCTTVINRALRLKARPIPGQATMHDHWLALVAVTTGATAYVDGPTILYRQHGGNVIGANRPRTRRLVQRVFGTLVSRERERVLKRYSRQAEVLLARFGAQMLPPQRAAAHTLAGLWDMPRPARFLALRRCGLGLRGLARNVALLIVVTRARRGSGRVDQAD